MDELELLIDLHITNHRQGPGNDETTMKAFELTGLSPENSIKIADIGCGTGAQTITLAKNTKAAITAIDIYPVFLNKLNRTAHKLKLNNINTRAGSMDQLSFDQETFDLIWSEGAIYNMGFEAGINYWKQFLKKGGYIAVSEISWLSNERPEELTAHWQKEYPQIDTVSGNIRKLESNGYSPVAHFIISKDCWMENYYKPLENGFEAFLQKYNHSLEAQDIVEEEKKDIAIFNKYHNFYGYGFYIAKKL